MDASRIKFEPTVNPVGFENVHDAQQLISIVADKFAQGQAGGQDGKDGVDGKSAYQIAVDNGFIGSEQAWLNSLNGVDGEDGLPNSLTIGEVGTLNPGEPATVSIIGVSPNQELRFNIPKGEKGDKGDDGADGVPNSLTIGTVETLPAGSQALASIVGDAPNQELNLLIPRGFDGTDAEPNTLTIGDVSTVDAGLPAYATITGVTPNQVLNLGIPKGEDGVAYEKYYETFSTATGKDIDGAPLVGGATWAATDLVQNRTWNPSSASNTGLLSITRSSGLISFTRKLEGIRRITLVCDVNIGTSMVTGAYYISVRPSLGAREDSPIVPSNMREAGNSNRFIVTFVSEGADSPVMENGMLVWIYNNGAFFRNSGAVLKFIID